MNYLIRRDATYYAQVRLTYSARFVLKTDVYRQSLRTKDFEKAKIRLRYVLSWIADLEMKNTSEMDDYKLYRHNWTGNARTIADYLKDEWPVDEERLWQRGNFEIMVNNYKRKMRISSGFSPNEFVPGFSDQFLKFINQNMEFNDKLLMEKAERKVEQQHKLKIENISHNHTLELEKLKSEYILEGINRGRQEERETFATYVQMLGHNQSLRTNAVEPTTHGQTIINTPSVETGDRINTVAPPLSPTEPEVITLPTEPTIAELIELYIVNAKEQDGDGKRRSEGKAVLGYLAHQMGHKRPSELKSGDFQTFFESLASVPNRHGIPAKHNKTLDARVNFMFEHTKKKLRKDSEYDCWSEFERCSAKTLEANHRPKLRNFLKYLVNEGFITSVPTLVLNKAIKRKLKVSLPRDSFQEHEIVEFLSSSMFTGAKSQNDLWHNGQQVVQGALYWCYLVRHQRLMD